MLAIRYLADGFSPHHFKLMTKTDKIEGKESRLRADQAIGNPSLARGPGPHRFQVRLLWVEPSRDVRLGPLELKQTPALGSRVCLVEEAGRLSRGRDMETLVDARCKLLADLS